MSVHDWQETKAHAQRVTVIAKQLQCEFSKASDIAANSPGPRSNESHSEGCAFGFMILIHE